MHKSLIIIDNFYDDPDAVRKLALTANYPTPEDTHTYPGRNSEKPFYTKNIHERLELIIGKKLLPHPYMSNGRFRISKESDSFKQDIHIDGGSHWAGVLFLSPVHESNAGTSFWRHKELGLEWCPTNPEEGKYFGFESFEDIRKKIIYADGLDRSKWDLTNNVPFLYNRLVLFRPWYWHSHGANFGNTLEDCRLVQLFFLLEEGEKSEIPSYINNVYLKHETNKEHKLNNLEDVINNFKVYRERVNKEKPVFIDKTEEGIPVKRPENKYFFED